MILGAVGGQAFSPVAVVQKSRFHVATLLGMTMTKKAGRRPRPSCNIWAYPIPRW